MYDIKALYEAHSVEEAIRLLCEHPQAKIIAGGSDVLVQIRDGQLSGKELVSIHGIDALCGVSREGDGTVRIGALTSFSKLAADPVIRESVPALGEAAGQVGSPQIRNIGTIGGNICNASAAADTLPTLLAWDAELELCGPEGVRRTPIRNFFLKARTVDLRPGELLTAILFPPGAYDGYSGKMMKYAVREALDISIVNCSVNVRLSEDKRRIETVRAAFGGAVGPVPVRALSAEAAAGGRMLNEETLELFAGAVPDDIHPRDGWRGSREFREHIARELAKRVFSEAVLLGGGMIHE